MCSSSRIDRHHVVAILVAVFFVSGRSDRTALEENRAWYYFNGKTQPIMIVVRNTIIPFPGFIAITLWPFVFVRRQAWARFTNNVMRHERIHGRQQVELLLVGAVLAVLMALGGCGWWSLLALPLFLWLYGLEWLLGLACFGDSSAAYRNISFEREAYDNEHDADYLNERRPFAWLRYISS